MRQFHTYIKIVFPVTWCLLCWYPPVAYASKRIMFMNCMVSVTAPLRQPSPWNTCHATPLLKDIWYPKLWFGFPIIFRRVTQVVDFDFKMLVSHTWRHVKIQYDTFINNELHGYDCYMNMLFLASKYRTAGICQWYINKDMQLKEVTSTPCILEW